MRAGASSGDAAARAAAHDRRLADMRARLDEVAARLAEEDPVARATAATARLVDALRSRYTGRPVRIPGAGRHLAVFRRPDGELAVVGTVRPARPSAFVVRFDVPAGREAP